MYRPFILPAISRLAFAVALALCAAGCSESIVETRGYVVPAGGTLKYRGQPVAGAQLTFLADDDESEPAFALSNAQGNFQCMTNDSSEGVRPGNYLVIVRRSQGGIPEKYASAETTTIEVTIADGDANDLPLELDD